MINASDSVSSLSNFTLSVLPSPNQTSNVTNDTAWQAITTANQTINQAELQGKNVTYARQLLDQAVSAFISGNYTQAQTLADQANLEASKVVCDNWWSNVNCLRDTISNPIAITIILIALFGLIVIVAVAKK